MLKIGDPAPAFRAKDHTGKERTLAEFRGRRVALWFFPKADTPGCTLEGQDFRDLHAAFKRANTTVLGISKDSCSAHAKFRAKEKFQFELLSDADETVCRLFDVIQEKSLYGRKFMGIERSTFLIGTSGKRNSSSIMPIIASAAFTGPGFDSMNRSLNKG